MKKSIWKAIHYWDSSIMADDYMTQSMNEMSQKGWEVFKIIQMPRRAELSHSPNESGSLGDGDSFSIRASTWIWYRK